MNTMSYALLKPYIALLVFVGLASGIVGCLAAASIVGVATTAVGLSFFSQTQNRAESEGIAPKKYPDEMQFCALT